MIWKELLKDKKNVVFLGEAGCGKSETAINLALEEAKEHEDVHFFDMDQTKPLFRSRDVKDLLKENHIELHYEEQMADAPTMVGGLVPVSLDPSKKAVVDVGGGDIGAKLIGGFSHLFKREDTAVFYIVNPYRMWSGNIVSVDETLSAVLSASRIQKVSFLLNPNLGAETTEEEFLDGVKKGLEMLSPYVKVEGSMVSDELYEKVKDRVDLPLIPIHPFLSYPWDDM